MREPDLIYIKEEMYDEHPIGQHMNYTDNRKSKLRLLTNNCISDGSVI